MTTITIQSQEVHAALAHLQRQMENLQPAFERIGDTLKSNLAMCFREEKSPDGINWAALSPVTSQRRHGSSHQILNDTGRLKNSIDSPSSIVATNSHVELTTDVAYATMMNFGGTKAQFPNLWGDIPARPFFPNEILPQNWETEILEIINNHLQN
jgi:phage virion morphogenesis protein